MALEEFPDINAFYAAHPKARLSPESDYGVHWQKDGAAGTSRFDTWRVSFVHNTGQVYAIRNSRAEGPVLILADWADRCGEKGSLDWLTEQLRAGATT